jgi:hypothetical protein
MHQNKYSTSKKDLAKNKGDLPWVSGLLRALGEEGVCIDN